MPGQWSYNEEEQCIINAENTGDLTGFYNPDDFTQSYIDLNFDWTTTDGDDDWMGAFVRFNKNVDGTCTTYVFLMSNGQAPWGGATGQIQGLYKIVNNNFNYANIIECQKITKKWVRNEWQNIRIIAEENNIKVYHKNELIIDYTDESDTQIKKGSYGFVSWSQANSKFKNIGAETMNIRSFEDVLREPEWREGAIKAIVNVQDGSSEQLENEETLGELLSRTLSDQIHFIGWGTNYNKTAFQNFIKSNNNNGIFINNTNYTNSINQTAEYIKTLANNSEVKNNSLILGEEVSINLSPPEIATNTKDTNYPNGKWKITHNFLYYENHIGQYPESGEYINDFITKFDRTGKYTITYQDGLINPSEVYVHRRPVAVIKSEKTGNSVTLQSNSYDLDSYSTGNNGIAEEKWQYKSTTDANWVKGKLTTVSGNTDYVVQLQVKDYQGVWSNPVSIFITNRTDAKPVANFEVKNREMTKYDTLEILDASYDPYGGKIVTKQWEVYQESALLYKGTNPPKKYTQTGNYSMKLVVTNDRGLTSEAYTRSFKIIEDNIAPEIEVTPTESNWAESTTVNIQISDLGGSNFKQYQYAITDSATPASSWSQAITKAQDNIVINEEGIKYLHIKAQDNAGNISEEKVVGPYKIDKSAPTVTCTGELEEVQIDYVDIAIQAVDDLSGIETLALDGKNIINATYRFTKNGTHTVVATDNLGHTTTVLIEINNIYYECTAGLEHPKYSSNYTECPICASYKGLSVTQNTHTYNGQEQGIIYDNPQNAEIIEYYDTKTQKPILTKEYDYELKVIYEEKEYKTGVIGKYNITPKEITITDIAAQSKVYNGNTDVILSGGRLQGICNEDEVRFILPYLGKAESKNVGEWNVTVDLITLDGKDAFNYTLKQPEYGNIKAKITKRILTIKDLYGKNRIYDGTDIVEIQGGIIVGIIQNDKVEFKIPQIGKAQSKNVGVWNVAIEPIELEGQDVENYLFIQPTTKDISVVISKEEGKLTIGCISKKYDRKQIQAYIVQKNSTSEITYHYYLENGTEEIEPPTEIGSYRVVATMPADLNYTETTSNTVLFQITKPDEPYLVINSKITKINEKPIENVIRKVENVNYLDTVTIEFTIENMGKGSGYAQKIINTLPKGITFLQDNETNIKNGWKLTKDGTVETEILSLQANIENEIFPASEILKDSKLNAQKTIELVLQIDYNKKQDMIFNNQTEIIQQDKHADTINYVERQSKNIIITQMNYQYADLKLENNIIQVIETNSIAGKREQYDIFQKSGEIAKIELAPKKIGNVTLELIYQISVKNEGNKETSTQNIKVKIPKGTNFDLEKNTGWAIDEKGNAVYNKPILVFPEQTKYVKMKLTWKVTENNISPKTCKAYLEAPDELDETLIKEGKISLEKTNNYSSSEIVIGIITGKMIGLGITIIILVLSILTTGIILIKKLVY